MNSSAPGWLKKAVWLTMLVGTLAAPALPAASITNSAALPGAPFENSLGMRFVPIPGISVLFSVWETRVGDYEAFQAATGRTSTKPEFVQQRTHPVVNVTWEDAVAFCTWLTAKERNGGSIKEGQRYRLPNDQEWTLAAGSEHETKGFPEQRMKEMLVWPWGHYWPPLPGDGNYAPDLHTDSFSQTAPVGSFKANPNGLYDMGGNVWEWCEDWFNSARVTKTLRGGSFSDSKAGYLLTTYRFSGTMNLSNEDIGFRVVLENSESP